MNKTDTKILVCCHTNDIYKSDEQYFPIHVGKEISDKIINIQGDNTGDNISEKNKSFCELTGMYWAWKNLPKSDYIGLCHYRRYFDFTSKFSFSIISILNYCIFVLIYNAIDYRYCYYHYKK